MLAAAHKQLGHDDLAREWFDKGITWMQSNESKWQKWYSLLPAFRDEAAELLGIELSSDIVQ